MTERDKSVNDNDEENGSSAKSGANFPFPSVPVQHLFAGAEFNVDGMLQPDIASDVELTSILHSISLHGKTHLLDETPRRKKVLLMRDYHSAAGETTLFTSLPSRLEQYNQHQDAEFAILMTLLSQFQVRGNIRFIFEAFTRHLHELPARFREDLLRIHRINEARTAGNQEILHKIEEAIETGGDAFYQVICDRRACLRFAGYCIANNLEHLVLPGQPTGYDAEKEAKKSKQELIAFAEKNDEPTDEEIQTLIDGWKRRRADDFEKRHSHVRSTSDSLPEDTFVVVEYGGKHMAIGSEHELPDSTKPLEEYFKGFQRAVVTPTNYNELSSPKQGNIYQMPNFESMSIDDVLLRLELFRQIPREQWENDVVFGVINQSWLQRQQWFQWLERQSWFQKLKRWKFW